MSTAWKVSKYRVISGPYFLVFGLNTEIYGVVFGGFKSKISIILTMGCNTQLSDVFNRDVFESVDETVFSTIFFSVFITILG